MGKKAAPHAPAIHNRKAAHRYELLDKLECGIMLTGTEVKSLRGGQASLDEAFARLRDGELWLIGMHIAPYEAGNVFNHDPLRLRKLLARRSEIAKIEPKLTLRGLTLVPVKVYFNERGLVKVQIALARGKAKQDKREDIKTRDARRDMERAMRRR